MYILYSKVVPPEAEVKNLMTSSGVIPRALVLWESLHYVNVVKASIHFNS